MELLTIGLLVCDNDVHLLQSTLEKIKNKVHIPYEVLLYDNTETCTLPPLDKDIKVFSKGTWKENVRQFSARKTLTQKAKGEYIWFIDPDDDFVEIDKSFLDCVKDDVDCVQFKYITDARETHWWKDGVRTVTCKNDFLGENGMWGGCGIIGLKRAR